MLKRRVEYRETERRGKRGKDKTERSVKGRCRILIKRETTNQGDRRV